MGKIFYDSLPFPRNDHRMQLHHFPNCYISEVQSKLLLWWW